MENFENTNIPYEMQTEDYIKPKVFVATPCYAGMVHVKFMECVMGLQNTLLSNGIGFEFFNIPFDSLIPRARNASVTRFMASKDATHLLFIDADIQFHPNSVIKMLRENKDVLCGCYPKKALDFVSLKRNNGDHRQCRVDPIVGQLRVQFQAAKHPSRGTRGGRGTRRSDRVHDDTQAGFSRFDEKVPGIGV